MRSFRFATLLALLLTLLAPLASLAQEPAESRTFAETGHSISGDFLRAWEATPNARLVLGLPISEPFIEESFTTPGTYYRVQYFERAVLEEHPEHYGTPYFVLGRLMGTIAAQERSSEPAFQPVADPGDGTWIGETGHTLSNEPVPFRAFWSDYGGVETFGYPISEPFEEVNQANGQISWVQYFERQRMEYHPQPGGVQLGLLGSEMRDRYHPNNPAFGESRTPAEPTPRSASMPDTDPTPEPTAEPTEAPTPEATAEPTEEPTPEPSEEPANTAASVGLPQQGAQGRTSDGFIYGYNAMLYHDMATWQDRARVLRMAKESGVPWVRQQVAWRDLHDISGEIHWSELDRIVDDVHNADMYLLISVVQAPSWATDNGSHGLPSRAHFGTFAHFMGAMAARYQGKVQAYEIWNEQNRACENGGDCSRDGGVGGQVASADYYVDMLYEAYNAIKASDPNAIVVSGGPTSTETNHPAIAMSDVTYVQNMLQNPKFRADVVGVHPGGQYNPPDSLWPDAPGPGPHWQNSREFYFRRIEDIHAAMVAAGHGDMNIWVTEFGWATPNNTPGYEYGNSISPELQAQYIVRAFEKGRYDYPWVEAMFLWNLNFAVPWRAHGNEYHEQASFGVLNGDWSPRPAWFAIRDIPKE